jgi:hypothetical protein
VVHLILLPVKFNYDYLAVAVRELNTAIRWRPIARDLRRQPCDGRTLKASLAIMRRHALRSRQAFNGELLAAN